MAGKLVEKTYRGSPVIDGGGTDSPAKMTTLSLPPDRLEVHTRQYGKGNDALLAPEMCRQTVGSREPPTASSSQPSHLSFPPDAEELQSVWLVASMSRLLFQL